MDDKKREWSLEEHKKHSPQLDKTQKHQDKQFIIGVILTIILVIVGFFINHYFYKLSSNDSKAILQVVEEIKIQQNESDIKKLDDQIFKETGFTYQQIKQIAINAKKDSKSYYELGLASSICCNDYQQAIIYYDQAIEKYPNDLEILNSKGIALFELGKWEDAIVVYDEALKLSPQNINLLSNKANVLFNLRKLNESMNIYDEIIKINSSYFKAWTNKGSIYMDLGNFDKAVNNRQSETGGIYLRCVA